MKKNIFSSNHFIKNKKAQFNYFLLDFYEAGIQLLGSEIKSIRLKNCSIDEAYIQIINFEAWILNMHIAQYTFSDTSESIDPRRTRKLLLHKHEIVKILKKKQEKSLTIIPISLYFKENYAKIKIALAKGKKLHDKRMALKEKSINLDLKKKNLI